jgi:hypothetical protein
MPRNPHQVAAIGKAHHDPRIVEDNQRELPDEGNFTHTLLSNLAREIKRQR